MPQTRIVLVALSICAFAVLTPDVTGARLNAQTTSAGTANQAPTFRSATTLVEVDAIVKDRSGAFVADLQASDFEVLEDGQPRTIEAFYSMSGERAQPPPTGAEPPIQPDRSAGQPLPEAAVPSAASRPAVQRLFVLLFDSDHLGVGPFKRLQGAARDFLTADFRDGDVGGVVSDGAMSGNRLTSSKEELIAAVTKLKPSGETSSRRFDMMDWPRFGNLAEAARIADGDSEALQHAVRRACDDDPGMCGGRAYDVPNLLLQKARKIQDEFRVTAGRTLRILQALVSGLQRLAGRKTIILMTEGFIADDFRAELRQIVGAAARSGVRVYSIDARGLDVHDQGSNVYGLTPTDPFGAAPVASYEVAQDAANALAQGTGGYVIRHTNEFPKAFAEIAADTSTYYVLAYAPPHGGDGTFHRINVRVKRQGLSVRARQGYTATPATK